MSYDFRPALQADTPVTGYYRFRWRRGAPACGVRIWYGPPRDPDTGEEMDRSWRWQAQVNGRYVDLRRVWPVCGAEPISPDEHDYLAYRAQVATAADPYSAPAKRVDMLTAALPF
jgi:hypothetical protein